MSFISQFEYFFQIYDDLEDIEYVRELIASPILQFCATLTKVHIRVFLYFIILADLLIQIPA